MSYYSFAQDAAESKAGELIQQAEKHLAEQQAKMIDLSDLEYTFWISVNSIDERKTNYLYVFLDGNSVLDLDSFSDGIRFPRYLIRYLIRDNKIFFTDILTGYLEDTYLYIGIEGEGYEKFKLDRVFSVIDNTETRGRTLQLQRDNVNNAWRQSGPDQMN
jgi:hypothetical protein